METRIHRILVHICIMYTSWKSSLHYKYIYVGIPNLYTTKWPSKRFRSVSEFVINWYRYYTLKHGRKKVNRKEYFSQFITCIMRKQMNCERREGLVYVQRNCAKKWKAFRRWWWLNRYIGIRYGYLCDTWAFEQSCARRWSLALRLKANLSCSGQWFASSWKGEQPKFYDVNGGIEQIACIERLLLFTIMLLGQNWLKRT